jgi:hypothetical protein
MSGIKSRPVYTPLRLDPAGRSHLIVSDLHELPENTVEPGADVELWLNTMLADLRQRLQCGIIGLRLYAVGTEPFLWDAHNIAAEAGLGKGEIYLTHAGSRRRRVYCTHCKTLHEDITTSIVICSACGANLFVRDHFSRRLAAFMGVAVDAEVPGAVPAPEVLYP